jgi:ectoine hydroxylase-related dioxygenase (phytanoyl-CoA dioxygenase family)
MSEFLNNDQIGFYEKNGYLVVDNILSDEECNRIIKKMERHANKDYAAILNPDRLEFLIAQSAETIQDVNELPDKVSYIGDCQETSQIFNDYFLKNPKSVGILETLYKSEMSGLMTQIIFKKAGSPYAPQAWTPHQDNSYVKNEKGLYVTTNFFLEEANEENGTLFVYPGSHKHGVFDAEDRASYREAQGNNPGRTISDDILKKFEKVAVSFKKGSMLVLHGNCIHGSKPNISKDKDRPIVMATYVPKGEYFTSGYNAQRKEISLH